MKSKRNVNIKENSIVAKLAAKKLGTKSVAIVIGKTIHLWNTKTEDFLNDEQWVKHEMCHVRQFQQFGFFGFIFRYLLESAKHGYFDNKYEVEARKAEYL